MLDVMFMTVIDIPDTGVFKLDYEEFPRFHDFLKSKINFSNL